MGNRGLGSIATIISFFKSKPLEEKLSEEMVSAVRASQEETIARIFDEMIVRCFSSLSTYDVKTIYKKGVEAAFESQADEKIFSLFTKFIPENRDDPKRHVCSKLTNPFLIDLYSKGIEKTVRSKDEKAIHAVFKATEKSTRFVSFNSLVYTSAAKEAVSLSDLNVIKTVIEVSGRSKVVCQAAIFASLKARDIDLAEVILESVSDRSFWGRVFEFEMKGIIFLFQIYDDLSTRFLSLFRNLQLFFR